MNNSVPTQSRCGECGLPVRGGWFDTLWQLYDLPPLSQWGEVCALLQGCRTFHVVPPNVYRRVAFSIRVAPSPTWGEVVREHRCGVPYPTADEVVPDRKYEPVPDEPPF